jgi:tRNA A37 threonylcarbamoyladenosine modification protein TsaB
MTILAIETSTDIAGAALLEGESLRASFAFRGRRDVCQRLLPNIQAMLVQAATDVQALSAIAA